MKIMYLMFLLLILISCKQNPEHKSNAEVEAKMDIEELENQGFETYQNNPVKAIPIFKKVVKEYSSLRNFEKVGMTNLNIANIYEEHLNQLDSALIYAQKSMQTWQTIKDTMQQANLYKYIGLLEGKMGDFQSAKADINEAIKLYTMKNFSHGIAVSKFNLADTYFRERNYLQSEKLLLETINHWKKNNNKRRIFTNNLFGIRLYQAWSKVHLMDKMIQENHQIASQINISKALELKFHKMVENIE